MKKIISILVALGLVLSLVVMATPTAASSGLSFVEVSLGSGGTGTAEWSDAYQKSGSYSVKLSAPYDGSYGRVVMPLGMAFADLDDFSVWVEGGTTAQALPLLVIKAVVDGTAILPASNKGTGTGVDLDDKTIVLASQPGQSEGLSPTLMSDGIAGWELYGTHSAATIDVGTGAYWSIFVYSADGTTFVGVYDYYTWAQIHTVLDGKATVTDVRVDLSWPQDGSGGVTSTVYVDDITINPVYDLEPAVGPNCACANAEYTIRFTTTASLTEGFNSITIAFPDGTTVPGTFADGDITINGMDVFGSEVTVSGTTVTFLVPEDVDAGVVTQVTFTDDAGIKNPCTAGTYNLYVNTSRAPDATPVKSPDYDISPAISEYEFVVNFGDTYPGIAEDFVPPFKACGQDGWGVANGTRWDTALNLTLQTKGIPGCATPCDNAIVAFHLAKAPTDATVTLSINGTWFTPTVCEWYTVANVTLSEDFTAFWDLLLHVDTVGDYEICFNATCPTAPVCLPPGSEVIVEWCMEFHAYQWKDVHEIDLYRKWNLISLPLVPFVTDIDAMLAAYPGVAEVDSIWHYDRCSDAWGTYAGAGLTDMYDGKSYWVKVAYSHSDPLKAPGLLHGTLYVWGTAQPMPPDAPSAYEVCEGWNMAGFRSMANLADNVYLWNFAYPGPVYTYGMIYSWDAVNQAWLSGAPGTVVMTPTTGYFIPFSVDGYIYP